MPSPSTNNDGVRGVVAVVFLDYQPKHQAWGWMRLVQGPGALKDKPGLRFAKVMGSGHGGGFSLRPSASHQGLVTVFEQEEQAHAFLAGAYVAQARERARESWSAVLAVDSARGEWDTQAWASTPPESLTPRAEHATDKPQPLAVITRASIRPAKAMAFWRYAPAAQTDLQKAPGCAVAIGLGEAPLVRQCTFSLWRDTPSMLAYAHGGAHQNAIEAAYRHSFFSESLFVRMRVLSQQGHWQSHAAP
jgi:spheroidene monooxygenase